MSRWSSAARWSSISAVVAWPPATSASATCLVLARSSVLVAGSEIGKCASARTSTRPSERSSRGRFRPKVRSTPRSASRVMKAARILFARRSSADCGSRHAAGPMATSKSSITSHPPGDNESAIACSARRRSGTCVSSKRACTRSNASPGAWSVATSCSRTSTPGGAGDRWAMSMSVATTVPVAPTRPASQVGTDAPPAPTSQQRQPLAMPIDVNVSNVLRSKQAASAAKRSSASLGASASR